MQLVIETEGSKIAAKIRNEFEKSRKEVTVTVSEHGPESIQLTGSLPRSKGWKEVTDVPIRSNKRKDYLRFISKTKYREVWIKVSTAGGHSRIYVR